MLSQAELEERERKFVEMMVAKQQARHDAEEKGQKKATELGKLLNQIKIQQKYLKSCSILVQSNAKNDFQIGTVLDSERL